MVQPMKAADPSTFSFVSLPNTVMPSGTITVGISVNPPQIFLSGGNLEELGWEASDQTITLSPLPSAELPVLYQFEFTFLENFRLVGRGLQISGSISEAFEVACVLSSPLELVNNVSPSSESVTLNLGMVVENLDTQLILNFGDPTIVFGPPQT